MKNNMFKNKIRGLGCPLITPMWRGKFDGASMKKLIRSLDTQGVDFFSVCMASGEGRVVNNKLWKEVIACAVSSTKKPIVASILGRTKADILKLGRLVKKLKAYAVAVPIQTGLSDTEIVRFYQEIAKKISLPILIYNLETNPITSLEVIKKLDAIPSVIGIKDSSNNFKFLKSLIDARKDQKLRLSVLQGMDHKLFESKGVDGYLVPLTNLEPALCKKMFLEKTLKVNEQILEKCWEYNLGGGAWYVSMKAILKSRGLIRSAEQVVLDFIPIKVI